MGFDFRRSVIGLEKPLQLLDQYEKQNWKPRDLVIRVFPRLCGHVIFSFVIIGCFRYSIEARSRTKN